MSTKSPKAIFFAPWGGLNAKASAGNSVFHIGRAPTSIQICQSMSGFRNATSCRSHRGVYGRGDRIRREDAHRQQGQQRLRTGRVFRFGWIKALGDAVLAQQADAMDAIQRLRSKAHDNKKLTSTKERLRGLACALIRDAAVPAGRHSGSADKVSAEMIRQLARRLHKSIQFRTD
jgi:hypothetical protein